MSQDQSTSGEDKPLVSTHVMEVATGVVIAALGALVAWSSSETGAGWVKGSGPEAGFFPFYIGLFILFSGLSNAIAPFMQANRAEGEKPFCTRGQFKSVMQVFIPTVIYVVLMNFIGLYVAAGLYIIGFMMLNGGFSFVRTLPYAIAVPVFLFWLFEMMFLISLPKGPIEAMLGF